MKILTAEQMREVDRRTIELGIPGIILMENAGHRVVEYLERAYAPLAGQRIAVLCGKGNNGGDGFVIARQLFTRIRPRALHVALAGAPEELKGDALANYRMLLACGCPVSLEIPAEARYATLVVDALLGTGLKGPASGRPLEWIREINGGFPSAEVVAVDLPSGMASDSGATESEVARANATVTFTTPKICHALPPNCTRLGKLVVAPIGSPPALYENDPAAFLSLLEPEWFQPLFAPRKPWSHKGDFGHVLALAGSRGKTGAAAMTGAAAIRAGAGLVTIASAASAAPVIAAHSPELMTEGLPETETGSVSLHAFDYGRLEKLAAARDVLAVGPGLSTHPETVEVVRRLFANFEGPLVVDADGLNALAGSDFHGAGRLRVLTPHPGEMSRLAGQPTAELQQDRVAAARQMSAGRAVVVVLKGFRTVVAFPDGRVWVNPSGSPALATGGTGDILTGLIAGLLAQFPGQPDLAVAAAVYLHGRSGELAAAQLGEQCVAATDLLRFLPAAMHDHLPHPL